MNAFDQLQVAINYSYESMTWVTWLVLFILSFRVVSSFNKAYENHTSYQKMKENKDRMALINFYIGIFLSLLCVGIFFLPYFFNYQA